MLPLHVYLRKHLCSITISIADNFQIDPINISGLLFHEDIKNVRDYKKTFLQVLNIHAIYYLIVEI